MGVLGEAHPDWDKLDRSEKRALEKEHRDRRLVRECCPFSAACASSFAASSFITYTSYHSHHTFTPVLIILSQAEEREAREQRYASYQQGGPAPGRSQRLLGPSVDAEHSMVLGVDGQGMDGSGRGPGGGDGGVPVAGDGGNRFHDFPITPMDEEGLRLRGVALRRGKPEVEDSEVRSTSRESDRELC